MNHIEIANNTKNKVERLSISNILSNKRIKTTANPKPIAIIIIAKIHQRQFNINPLFISKKMINCSLRLNIQ
jgi:hypothetical protein